MEANLLWQFFTLDRNKTLQLINLNKILKEDILQTKPSDRIEYKLQESKLWSTITHNQTKNLDKWYFINTCDYIHPATVTFLAEILDYDIELFIKWIGGLLKTENGNIQTIHYHEYTDSIKDLLESTEIKNDFLIKNSLCFEDFIWNIIPIPPPQNYPLVINEFGLKQYSLYHQLLKNIISRRDIHPKQIGEIFRGFMAYLHQWIEIVIHPKYDSLWQLTPNEVYTFPFSYSLDTDYPPVQVIKYQNDYLNILKKISSRKSSLKVIKPSELEKVENTISERILQESVIIDNKILLEVTESTLIYKNIDSDEFLEEIKLPFNYSEFYKLDDDILYIKVSSEHLLAFHIYDRVFLELQLQQDYFDYYEYVERAMLISGVVPTTIQLTEVHDYPIVYQFSFNRKYFFCMDKEYQGGLYNLQTGLCVISARFMDNPQYKNLIYQINLDGSINMIQEFIEEYDVLEIIGNENIDNEEEEWQKLNIKAKTFCFGFYDGKLVVCFNNNLYYKQLWIASFAFPVSYIQYSEKLCYLYIRNSQKQMILNLKEILEQLKV
ncbi:MAG: hypothetical protein MUC49_10970 [Raineya sp.]|jgi:hypothetical protein|nr:hypothetical protein [Raineya sp.]